MARRAEYGRYDVTMFKDFIKYVIADLGITGDVKFKFADLNKFDGRHYYDSFYGGKYANHWILVNRDNTRARIYFIIAHELRHAYQHQTGMLRWNGNVRQWNGVDYIDAIEIGNRGRSKKYFNSNGYRNQPWEVDANEYAEKIVARYTK